MREPENLKELIEYFEWNYERMEDDHDVICTFTDGDGFHDLLNDLKRKSAMCEADSNSVLGDGWRDVRKELPDASGDCIVYTLDNRIEIDEYTTNFGWYIDRVGGKVIAWMPLSVIGKPAFA